MRRGASLIVLLAVLSAAGAARATTPPGKVQTGVEVWGQPDRGSEVAGRPLATSLALFRTGTTATLPPAAGLMRPLSYVAAHMRGNPGTLVADETRRVTTPAGFVYLVPTTNGWLCVQGPTFQTCHRGLLRQGVTWSFYSTATGIDVLGIAADDVRTVKLTWRGNSRTAQLAHNVFFVHRPLVLTSIAHLPAFGRLAVAYGGGKTATSVAIR